MICKQRKFIWLTGPEAGSLRAYSLGMNKVRPSLPPRSLQTSILPFHTKDPKEQRADPPHHQVFTPDIRAPTSDSVRPLPQIAGPKVVIARPGPASHSPAWMVLEWALKSKCALGTRPGYVSAIDSSCSTHRPWVQTLALKKKSLHHQVESTQTSHAASEPALGTTQVGICF